MSHYRNLLAVAVASGLSAMASTSAYAADFTDTAPVVSTSPILERIHRPRQECYTESVTTNEVRREGNSPVGAILGGIAGGVLGHQIGGGRGRDVATAAGAVTGAVVGNNIDNADRGTYVSPTTRDVQRCRTVDSVTEVIRGYNVTYRYNGRDVAVRLPYDPGRNVRVGVSVLPDSPPVSYGPPPRY